MRYILHCFGSAISAKKSECSALPGLIQSNRARRIQEETYIGRINKYVTGANTCDIFLLARNLVGWRLWKPMLVPSKALKGRHLDTRCISVGDQWELPSLHLT